jgi:hypothetical protein
MSANAGRHSAHGTRHSAFGIRPAGRRLLLGVIVACAVATGACTKRQLEGSSNSYAVVNGVFAASGARPTDFAGYLSSDVITYVKKNLEGSQVCVPTILEDSGRASMHLGLKDPGSADLPTFPSPSNSITFSRYHVNYRRADGRNTPGVDVPYGFDGGMTLALIGGNVSIGQLTLVRAQAKQEAPLKALIGGGGANSITTIAELTFYGTDQTGRAVTAEGFINVTFADWGDPDC